MGNSKQVGQTSDLEWIIQDQRIKPLKDVISEEDKEIYSHWKFIRNDTSISS